jgi:hypothetical protein
MVLKWAAWIMNQYRSAEAQKTCVSLIQWFALSWEDPIKDERRNPMIPVLCFISVSLKSNKFIV